MEDPQNIDSLSTHAIRDEVRRIGHDQLTRARYAPNAAQVGVIGQEGDRPLDPQYNATCGPWVILADVFGFFLEISQRPLQPPNLHDGAND